MEDNSMFQFILPPKRKWWLLESKDDYLKRKKIYFDMCVHSMKEQDAFNCSGGIFKLEWHYPEFFKLHRHAECSLNAEGNMIITTTISGEILDKPDYKRYFPWI